MVLQVTESKNISGRNSSAIKDVLKRYAKHLRPGAEALHQMSERNFPQGSPSLLYIHQREYVVLPLEDTRGPQFVGTDEATTCHIVVLLSLKQRILAFGHVDGTGIEDFLADVQTKMRQLGDDLSLGIDAHLVGGFVDPNRESAQISAGLLRAMAASEALFRLRTAAITDLNDEFRSDLQLHFPRRYGLAVDLEASRRDPSGVQLLPASFEAYGPCPELRRTRFCGTDLRMSCVYDATSAQLRVQPFHYSPPAGLLRLVNESADFLRQFSTSPLQERPGFEERLRCTLQFMLQHPQPLTDVFREDRPLCFRLHNGEWLPAEQR